MSIGLFIPLPKGLAEKFPSLGDHDPSPPHATLLYFGEAPEDTGRFLDVVRAHLQRWPGEITATLRGLKHFDNPDATVAYNSVRFDADVAGLRSSLIAHLSDNGFPSTDRSPTYYYPHVTLAYLPPNSVGEYRGPVPVGSWTFDEVEVWGLGEDPVVLPLGGANASRVAAKLYHITGWRDLAKKEPGDTFTLKPGQQHAEGPGVYFSQDVPVKVTTAEGTAQSGAAAVVETEAASAAGWWRTKPSLARKFNRPITWHTDGKPLSCEVQDVGEIPVTGAGTLPLLKSECSFSRVAAKYKSKKKIETKDGDEATVYEYGPRQVANRHREKAERVEHLRQHISDLRARVKDDLKSDDPHTRMTALAVSLMDHTCERVGNDDSADNGHYGVTGWLKKHITVRDGKATIKYVGKSGVKHEKTVDDGPTVTALKELCEGRGGGEAIFDTDDAKVSADDVNDYLAEFDVTAKDIRGFRANDEMCKALRAERAKGPKDLPRARKEKDEILKAEFKRALETVAEVVGHEAATLRSQYLVPGLEDQYVHDGTVLKSLKVGTKTDAQREDEATEKLVKPAPKKKPPRHDLRNERVESDDPDLDDTDDDLSLNFKKVASPVRVAMAVRVAARYLWAKGVNPSSESEGGDDAEEEFLKSVEGKLFKTPKSDKSEGVSYSHLKKIDPEMAKAEREKFVPKGKDSEGGGKDEEKKREDTLKSPATTEEVQQSVEKIQSSEAAKSLSESDRERVSDLISSVMSGQSRSDKEKLEAGIEQHNAGNVEKLKGGVDRKTVDALRRVPKGIYGEGVKMSTFDSKKSGDLIAKKQKSREKVEKDYEQARNDVRDLPSEIKESEDREEVENQDLESETKTLKDLEAKVEKAGENADPKDKADITRLKAKVSTRQRAIQKLKVTRDVAQKKLTVAQKRLPSLKDSYEKETSELNAMTAYHVSQEHLSSHLTDMSKGSDNPAKRLSEAAKHLSSLPPEMADKAREGAKAHRDQIKKDYDNAAEEDREAMKKELDLADSVVAAGVHDKYLRMDEREAEEDNKASFIRTLHGAGVGADNEHVQALLREGSSQKDVAEAVHNLARKMPKGALAQREFGDTYDMFADSPYISRILEQSAVDSLVGEFKKGRVKGKGDKGKADRVKQLAETANTEDLTDEQREAIKKVVRDKAKDLPAADRETVTDIVELDIPDAAAAPEGDGGKKKGPSSPGEYRQMLLDNATDEEARKRVKDLSSEELNEKWEAYKSGKTARLLNPRRLAARFLAYSTSGR